MAQRVGLRVEDQAPVILHKSDRDDVARCLQELNAKVGQNRNGALLTFVLCIIDGGEPIYRKLSIESDQW
jgi:hypothetical protein